MPTAPTSSVGGHHKDGPEPPPSADSSTTQPAPKNKDELIEQRRKNLPLPEDPPTKPDGNSASAVGPSEGVGSGRTEESSDKALGVPGT